MLRAALLVAVSLPALAIASAALAEEVIDDYKPVTAERLKNPEPGDWLYIRRTYDGQSHSPLKEITPDNVAQLQQVWNAPTGSW